MVSFGGILSAILSGLKYFFSFLGSWLAIFFVIPFKNPEMLWILIPIWINLIFTDFFQEKKGTSFGNAVTNGAVMLWVSVDWIRFLIRSAEGFSWSIFFKFFLCALVVATGVLIIIQGVRAKESIKIVGRVRETSYIMLVISPAIYGVATLSFKYIIAIVVFFPLFYGVFELVDRYLPNPATYEEGGSGGGEDSGGLGDSGGGDDFKI